MIKSYFCRSKSNIYWRLESFSSVSCRLSNYQITLRSRLTFQNLKSTMWLAKHRKGMLSSDEQAFVGRDEKRAPLKTPAWEAMLPCVTHKLMMETGRYNQTSRNDRFFCPICNSSIIVQNIQSQGRNSTIKSNKILSTLISHLTQT